MPHYFFDIKDDQGVCSDEEGLELPDLRAAKVEAVETLAGIAREHKGEDVVIEVRCETDPVFQAALIFQTKTPKQ